MTMKRRRFLDGGREDRLAVKAGLWAMSGGRCHWCGRRLARRALPGTPEFPTIDHVVPLAAGGADDAGNRVIACLRCNHEKDDSSAAEWMEARR